jgi:hypothetical protein
MHYAIRTSEVWVFETVAGMDAGAKPTWMYSRRVSKTHTSLVRADDSSAFAFIVLGCPQSQAGSGR